MRPSSAAPAVSPLRCRARVLKLGRRLVYGVAECLAGDRLLTHHTLTYARMGAGQGQL